MLCSLLYDLLRLLIEILLVRGRGDAKLRAEVLALRHQLGVLGRQGRPAALAAWRSPIAERNQPDAAEVGLGIAAAHP